MPCQLAWKGVGGAQDMLEILWTKFGARGGPAMGERTTSGERGCGERDVGAPPSKFCPPTHHLHRDGSGGSGKARKRVWVTQDADEDFGNLPN